MNGSTSSAFGGGGGFGGGSPFTRTLGGSTPGNFATPGAAPVIKSDKPAKPFGAPDSDAEDDSDKDSDSEGDEAGVGGKDGEKDDAASRDESTPAGGEDEKRAKYKKGLSQPLIFAVCNRANNVQLLSTMAKLAKQPSFKPVRECTTSTSPQVPMARRRWAGASAAWVCSRSTCP